MSGAPILAVRGEGGGWSGFGIALAASARTEYRLKAQEGAERTQDPLRPYEGPIYLQPVEEIRYGITFSVPMDVIRQFLDGAPVSDEGPRISASSSDRPFSRHRNHPVGFSRTGTPSTAGFLLSEAPRRHFDDPARVSSAVLGGCL